MCKHYTYMFWPEPRGQPDNSEAEAARLFWLAKPSGWHCRSASAASRPAGRAVTVARVGRDSTAAAVLWARLILIGTARPDRHFQDLRVMIYDCI